MEANMFWIRGFVVAIALSLAVPGLAQEQQEEPAPQAPAEVKPVAAQPQGEFETLREEIRQAFERLAAHLDEEERTEVEALRDELDRLLGELIAELGETAPAEALAEPLDEAQQEWQELGAEEFSEPLENLREAANDIIDRLLQHEGQLSVEREDLEELQERLNEVIDAVVAGNEMNGVGRDAVAELQNVVNSIFNAVLVDLPENDAAQQQQQQAEQGEQELAAQEFREPLENLQEAANGIIDRLLEHEGQLSIAREDLEELQERLNEVIDGSLANGVQRESVEELQEVFNDIFAAVLEDLEDGELDDDDADNN
jgi:hypothetical protein